MNAFQAQNTAANWITKSVSPDDPTCSARSWASRDSTTTKTRSKNSSSQVTLRSAWKSSSVRSAARGHNALAARGGRPGWAGLIANMPRRRQGAAFALGEVAAGLERERRDADTLPGPDRTGRHRRSRPANQ